MEQNTTYLFLKALQFFWLDHYVELSTVKLWSLLYSLAGLSNKKLTCRGFLVLPTEQDIDSRWPDPITVSAPLASSSQTPWPDPDLVHHLLGNGVSLELAKMDELLNTCLPAAMWSVGG